MSSSTAQAPARIPPSVTRDQILAFRRTVQALDERLPWSAAALRRAAWAGLQDSMPRAALLSLHARVAGTGPTAIEDPALVQVWGPRFSVFVIAAQDVAPFTLGRHPEGGTARRRAQEMAAAMAQVLGPQELPDREVARALRAGNKIRYATTTGTLLIRWDGARAPVVRSVTPPAVDPAAARRELARRYLHVYGPTDADTFARWAGIAVREARGAFAQLSGELLPVRTAVGDRLALASDESALRSPGATAAPARLLPSGDALFLLQGADRELLVPDPALRAQLWTPRVWPGAVLLAGEVLGTWRRAGSVLTVEPWRRLTLAERDAIEAEAAGLPLPGLTREVGVRWVG